MVNFDEILAKYLNHKFTNRDFLAVVSHVIFLNEPPFNAELTELGRFTNPQPLLSVPVREMEETL